MPLTVATWNVNSVRLRIGLVARFVAEYAPDVLCLQETKSPDEFFPIAELAALGYPHSMISGMKSYNGVAIFSRRPLERLAVRPWVERADCRHVAASIDGIELHNFYVPAGGDIADPALNPKFAHKLGFLDEMAEWFAAQSDRARPMILVGDLNVAPLEHDVWSHKQLLTVVSHTPVEIARLARVQASAAWIDVARRFVPVEEKLYSWWSYRARDWRASDRGRRLDHIWVTPPLEPALRAFAVAKSVRDWPRTSDHAPVLATLAV